MSVRVIAATNRDLPAEVWAGRFREDLHFRMTRKNRLVAGALLVFGALMVFQTQPALGDSTSDRLHQDHDLLGQSIGLAGYDPVSYFPQGGGQAAKGLISITAEHAGVTDRFATEEHNAAFLARPERYLPAFAGWCRWAMGALGMRLDVDPDLGGHLKSGHMWTGQNRPFRPCRDRLV